MPSRPLPHGQLTVTGQIHIVEVFIDSGANANFMDGTLAAQLRVEREPLPKPVPASALDGRLLCSITHRTSLPGNRALKLYLVSRLLGRIRRITGFFHHSAIAIHALQEKQRLLELPPQKLKNNVAIR
ncbi:hypothetical protein N1851_010624 [Merluccius polli]|uniref:Uncharacterized protein n=1 Tax=Merluccius polli TaxID=89951 RepID=A0AA47P5F1_MERPO|nr:hypothetical protein N1851_010624 [Merluccius polli]